jgi:signal transduction histidine kinase
MTRNSTENSQRVTDDTRRRGDLVVRTIFILLIPLLATFLSAVVLRLTGKFDAVPELAPPGVPHAAGPLVPIVVLVVFFSALIVLVRLGRPTISALLLIGTWTLLTTLTALQFGVTTYFPALLILPICAAGLLIDRVASIALAGLATILVASAAFLEQSGAMTSSPMPMIVAAQLPLLSIGFWVGLFWGVAALTALLAGGMQMALRRSAAQAEELRSLSAQLEARVQEQTTRLLAKERDAATLEERNRLAREIHDTLAQGLAGVVVQLGAIRRALDVAPGDVPEHLGVTEQMARETLAEARRSVWNLRAGALERGDLGDALRGLAERRSDDQLAVTFAQEGAPQPLVPEAEAALLRVGQEALANVARHAHAARVALTLAYAPDAVCLTVRDDGVGFAPEVLAFADEPRADGGFGLLGMRERLAALGGRVTLVNDGGAVVIASVPWKDTP